MDQRVRWGILSTARIGLKSVIPAIQQSRNGVAAAIASREARNAERAARALGIPQAFGSYEAMLDSGEIDAVYIPLPNSLHKEWTIRTAVHGKHVLCEKPLALDAAQAAEMAAAARQNHVLLMEAFMYRFHPQFARLRTLIAEGAIGRLQVVRSAFTFHLDRPGDIRLRPELGGGALYDLGCYCVNMSRLVTGTEPIAVQGHALVPASRVDETFAAILRFPDDIVAVFDCSFRSAYREWLSVVGTDARLELPRPIKPGVIPAHIILHRSDDTTETLTTSPANHYQLMVEHFADAVLEGKDLRYPPEEGHANMRVIDGLYESARTGRTVELAREPK